MKTYDCHFEFTTTLETHGSNELGAIANLSTFINDEVKSALSHNLGTGIDYDEEAISAKKLYDGWYELETKWTGFYSVDEENEEEAKNKALSILDNGLTPFYQSLEIMSFKNRRFLLSNLTNHIVTDVLE